MHEVVRVQERLGHVDLHPLAPTGAITLVQRRDHRRRQVQSRVHVGVAHPVLHGDGRVGRARGVRPPTGAGLDEAHLGVDHDRVRAPVRPHAGLAVPADRREHEARVRGVQRVPAEPEAGHHPGPIVLDHHVDVLGEVAHDRRTSGTRRSIEMLRFPVFCCA